jgi:paraquat-inducible protein A
VNRLSGGRAASPASVRECSGCGLLQSVAPLEPGMTAHCGRCSTTLHRKTKHPIDHGIALALAALILLTVTCTAALMSVQTAGIAHTAYLLSGPSELVARGMAVLAAVVIFVTVVAPYGKLLGTLYVLVRLHERQPPAHLRRVFVVAEWLRPWSMMEVFVFGVFVAYTKLGDIVTITLDTGVYALLALTIVLIWADSALDREEVWDRIGAAEGIGAQTAALSLRADHAAIGCEVCGLVSEPSGHDARCPRCESHLHPRKPDSLGRTWALVIAAAVLYVPANYFPVLTVVQLGAGQPSTIIGGVEELVQSGLYPLAALVFFASIAVPTMKLFGLSFMLITTQLGYGAWLRDRTRLYHAVRWIGRWSMIDIFMEALLGALVRFGSLVTIEPGIGAVAFCGVVVLTMLAAETFDPRLMWDAAKPKWVAATAS